MAQSVPMSGHLVGKGGANGEKWTALRNDALWNFSFGGLSELVRIYISGCLCAKEDGLFAPSLFTLTWSNILTLTSPSHPRLNVYPPIRLGPRPGGLRGNAEPGQRNDRLVPKVDSPHPAPL